MKRLFCALLVVVVVFSTVPTAANAAECEQTIIHFADGGYLVSEVIPVATRAAGEISASKPYTYYDANGRSQWMITLSGVFRYTGSSAVCTDASASVTVYDSSWYTISKTTREDGASAVCAATMGRKGAGATSTFPVSLRLTCDANGNLS